MEKIYLTMALSPLIGAIIAGFFGRILGRNVTHTITILGVLVSTVLALMVFDYHVLEKGAVFNQNLYTWMQIGGLNISVGFLVDNLTSVMLVVVSFVSLMVHIYTIGYMSHDKDYTKFFSYISLFTFSMFMLVMSNNFMQLFFGWEAVGLVSYLLIGFWHHKESAIEANLKAFLVNRVGDFGFLLGIGLVLAFSGSLDYAEVFASLDNTLNQTLWGTDLITVICLLLFVGAMGKSAQVPLHVWLPGSMEGPTPISALIHAATMVTAGIFMVSRMSPMFEMSDVALTVVMIVGAITALFMGLLGIVQNDIKKVVAYSTLSQLGYMTVALGVSAYSVAIFHLMTHAFFKALLFLGAGSVIVAMHHEQDIRKMGGLKKTMPITYWTALIGTLALIGFPGFAGFYSKDMIIEAVHFSSLPYADWVYYAVVVGVFITAFYSFRMFFLVFHGESRVKHETAKHLHESPLSITFPLIMLAIPSAIIGYFTIEPMLFKGWLDEAITVTSSHVSMVELKQQFHGALGMIFHALQTLPFWMMVGGIVAAWVFSLYKTQWAIWVRSTFKRTNYVLESLYGFDRFNEIVFVGGVKKLGNFLWKVSDSTIIDLMIVNGSARFVGFVSSVIRPIQTGYVYHYAFFMIFSLLIILTWALFMGDQPLLEI
ncbi:NADH-quinone oxidoreductase subunit L [bacterium endosymbiont of Bathymodiolus sp. 5 South]|jgi:NADH-quinone oxidoreductase subunit L|uniref:NADH-quinone oxidoreductase subunit L n=1 Tax=bacterium endosymbiont of Bathymodiolus sp. 5 South TaxID=1181670 RepID=UPI0010B1D6D4|nr:NADH-quinone oxidoreductase subunit L [bacterium endosymbiont of Bathymodiolus sp. 5 South]CAC9647250.1 NADH-ubiquinone oxidoreductase chain L (EC 1.6.5.3) [uncultured Gammaproteobacteria bacterium]SHN90638.1 NADH-ubiquinone oxidoreductase chain L [bacterium endosymbiont of Bathymodiolus sp. 5 South]SSC08364.1 NADH-ubiquinone oxidoreductase chain L [bacterium endosymbiont of Bathymodiolus sp. 5 South]VVH55293.1 NADH-ubiquinone oxidoreductase chain L (EC [uncultured Gammaproteobacteria bacter